MSPVGRVDAGQRVGELERAAVHEHRGLVVAAEGVAVALPSSDEDRSAEGQVHGGTRDHPPLRRVEVVAVEDLEDNPAAGELVDRLGDL